MSMMGVYLFLFVTDTSLDSLQAAFSAVSSLVLWSLVWILLLLPLIVVKH